MHELSIMQSALDVVFKEAQRAQASRVYEVRLRIGALSGVVPEALELAFQALTSGTLAEGARMTVENVPARYFCERCQQEFESGDLFAECPVCRQLSRELKSGRELELASMEIE